jgi:hypothetical protein
MNQRPTTLIALAAAAAVILVVVAVVVRMRQSDDVVVVVESPRPPEAAIEADSGDGSVRPVRRPKATPTPRPSGGAHGEATPTAGPTKPPLVEQTGETTGSLVLPGAQVAGVGGANGGVSIFGDTNAALAQAQARNAALLGQDAAGSRGSGSRVNGGRTPDNPDGMATPSPGQGQIGGRVTRGGRGVADAALTLIDDETREQRTTTANGDGVYRFPPVLPGEYTIMLTSPKAPTNTRYVVLAADQSRLQEDFSIPDLPPVVGTVTDANKGEGVPSAVLTVSTGSTQIGSVSGEQDGTFELMPLEPGQYLVRTTARGYLDNEQTVTVQDSYTQQRLAITLTPSQRVTGVVRGPGGQPVSGAAVSLFREGSAFGDPYAASGVLLTGADGRFEFGSLPSGATERFRVGAHSRELLAAYGSTIFDPATPEAWGRGDVTLGQGISATGTVVDTSGEAIPDAYVEIISGFPSTRVIYQRVNAPLPNTRTGIDGTFTLPGVEAAPLTARFSAEGYITVERSFTPAGGDLAMGTIELRGEDEPEPGKIAGIIVDERGNKLSAQTVFARCLDCATAYSNSKVTDSAGAFSFDECPEGTYSLTVSGAVLRDNGLFIKIDQVHAGARPGEEPVVIVFDLGQRATVRLTDQSGQPVGRVVVGVHVQSMLSGGANGMNNFWSMGYRSEAQTSGGFLEIRHLLHGTARITLSVPGGDAVELEGVEIAPGETVDLGDVTLGPTATIVGQVVRQSDTTGLGGALVRVLAPEGSAPGHPLTVLGLSTVSGSDGRFTIPGVPLGGTADLEISLSGYINTRVRGLELVENQTTDSGATALQRAGTVRGRVTNPEGGGVAALVRGEGVLLYTDASGLYQTTVAVPGDWTWTFEPTTNQYLPASQAVTVQEGATVELNVTVSPRGS